MASTATLASDHLAIRDFSDREILAVMLDEMGRADGAVESRALAIRIFGIPEENEEAVKYYNRCTASRFAWMRRFGFVDKGEKKGEWVMTELGEAMLRNRLPAALSSRIEAVDDAGALSLGNAVGLKLVGSGDVAATAMRRELLFQIERRKRGAR